MRGYFQRTTQNSKGERTRMFEEQEWRAEVDKELYDEYIQEETKARETGEASYTPPHWNVSLFYN